MNIQWASVFANYTTDYRACRNRVIDFFFRFADMILLFDIYANFPLMLRITE